MSEPLWIESLNFYVYQRNLEVLLEEFRQIPSSKTKLNSESFQSLLFLWTILVDIEKKDSPVYKVLDDY